MSCSLFVYFACLPLTRQAIAIAISDAAAAAIAANVRMTKRIFGKSFESYSRIGQTHRHRHTD